MSKKGDKQKGDRSIFGKNRSVPFFVPFIVLEVDMKRKVEKTVSIFVMAAFIGGFFSPLSLAQNPIRKLGRGVANTAMGILEVPTCIEETLREDGIVGAVTYGVIKGVARALLRTVVGIYETTSFLIPVPWQYEPILEPEFMLSEQHF